MKGRSNLYSYVVVLAVMIFLLVLTIRLEYPMAQYMPYLGVSIGLLAAVIGLVRTVLLKEELVAGVRSDEARMEEEGGLQGWRRYMLLVWLAVVYMTFMVFGIVIGTGLFVGSYMKFYGARWWVAALFTIITPAFIYLLFKVALGLYLYNGLFFPS